MRVLHIHFGRDGGAERFLVTLSGALADRGLEQAAIIRPERPWREDLARHARIVEGNYRRYLPTRFLMEARLYRLLSDFKPDVVMAWMSRACRLLPSRTTALRVARLGDYPTKLDYFRHTDLIVCNAPGIAEHVRQLGWTGDLQVISNFTAVDAPAPVPRDRFDTPDDAFLVVGAGRFVPRKGFDLLIEALATLPGAYLWLVGDGEQADALRDLADRRGTADRVRFLGWQSNTGAFLAAADVVVMPSRHEPLGNVVLEAWGAGRPVVVTASEGPRWIVSDDVDGYVVPIDDAPALAARLACLRADPGLSARLAAAGQVTLKARFGVSAVTDAYVTAFGRRRSP